MDDPSGLLPGAQLGKYRLERQLGRGGMGEVWAAHDPDLDRRVALKVLRTAVASEEGQARLLREGRAMARLRHPNVITVYEATTAGGRDLIAMELVDGESLAGWLTRSHPRAEIVRVLLAAGRGLAAAHDAGMIHRDFKPHNVLVDRDGRVLVTDFGLARASEVSPAPPEQARPAHPEQAFAGGERASRDAALEETALGETATAGAAASASSATRSRLTDSDRAALHSPLTRTGALLGTPAYMAPEQLAGQPADARSDQFAFCVTAWEALAGARPFRGTTLRELEDAVVAGVPADRDKLPGRLRAVLERGLAGDPARRWPAMAPLLRAFERAWHRPRRVAIGAGAVTAIAVAVAASVTIATRDRRETIGPCPPVAEAFAAVDGPQSRAITERLRKNPHAARAIAFFDRWRASWRATYRTTCQRAGEPAFAARRSCLESQRDQLASFIALADTVPPEAMGSTDMVTLIPPPELCLERPSVIGTPEPTDPAIRAELRRIRSEAVKYRAGIPLKPALIAANLERLIADARATGYLPTVADLLVVRGDALAGHDRAVACPSYEEGANLAEQSSAELVRIRALAGLLECAMFDPRRRNEIDPLLARARGVVDRLGDRAQGAMLEQQRAWILGDRGDWDAAIAAAAAALVVWGELDAPVFAAKSTWPLALFLRLRHQGDDLATAERAIRAALDWLPPDERRTRVRLRAELGELLWTMGRFDEAIPLRLEHALPAPGTGAMVTVTVVDREGKPVGDAEVVAAVDPAGDPTRIFMAERRAGMTARTDRNGVATVQAPSFSLVLARKGYDVAAVMAPGRPGALRLVLAPAGSITGRVTVAPIATPPADPLLARRAPLTVQGATLIGGLPWTVTAPVDAKGEFKLPIVFPGRYSLDVAATSAAGDTQAGMGRVSVGPGETASVELSVAPPVALRVVLHPAVEAGFVLVWPGHAPTLTWPAASVALASAAHAAGAPPGPPVIVADDAAKIGDAVALIGAPGAGPVTVCALAGVKLPGESPIGLVRFGPSAPPSTCVTATTVDGAVTTVVVPTAR